MRHTGNGDHPATNATCEAVSEAQADHLETLGWSRIPPATPDTVETVADTAAGLEHDTAALQELAGLDPDQLAAVAAFATAAAESTPVRDAPSRRGHSRTTPEEG
jgi:hypothetical protein